MKRQLWLACWILVFVTVSWTGTACAGVIFSSQSVLPNPPHADEPLIFRLRGDTCPYHSDPPVINLTGNIISIVETFRIDPTALCFEPYPYFPFDYPIGSFAEGQYVARYTAILEGNTIYGPVEVPFSVVGAVRPIPTLDRLSLVLMTLSIAGAALLMRHRTIGKG
jgi:hypothetical protein